MIINLCIKYWIIIISDNGLSFHGNSEFINVTLVPRECQEYDGILWAANGPYDAGQSRAYFTNINYGILGMGK